MGLQDISFKNEYRSLRSNIVKDFYLPALKESILYQRSVGFFSSSALTLISEGISGLIKNHGKIQLVASPRLSESDIDEIRNGYEAREVIEKALLRGIESPECQIEVEKLSYMAELIARGILDIRIAYLPVQNSSSLYHEKLGLLTDEQGNTIAFFGSNNETGNAMENNYEVFDTFCSWKSEESRERVEEKRQAFNDIWEGQDENLITIEFPQAVKQKLLSYRSSLSNFNLPEPDFDQKYIQLEKPFFEPEDPGDAVYLPDDFEIRPYQKDAIENWMKNDFKGIFDMATGTGKTLTGLAGITKLYQMNHKKLAVFILCPQVHLIDQWVEDIRRFGINPIIGHSKSKQKNWVDRLRIAASSFKSDAIRFFCCVTTIQSFTSEKVQNIVSTLGKDCLIVVDEAHNIGAQKSRKALPNQFPYRLALSATLERKGDKEGTQYLQNYFGEKCISYSLKDAIESGMLTRYYYHPVIVTLDPDELEEYADLTQKIATMMAAEKNRKKKSEALKRTLLKRSRVVAGAANKFEVLEKEMEPYKNDDHILVYCGATSYKETDDQNDEISVRQIDKVIKLLGNDLDMRVGRFTSQEDSEERELIKEKFTDGELQALAAIKCLDEGVNIPSIKVAFILASTTNPKEYIQRRGRVLRKFEGKKYAEIYDFITLPFLIEEYEDQPETTRNLTRSLVKRELRRMKEFASLAENKSETNEIYFDLKGAFRITNKDLEEKDWEEEDDEYN